MTRSHTLAPERVRYEGGGYDIDFGDDKWKATQMGAVIASIAARESIRTLADVGCGNGGVLARLRDELRSRGFALENVVGYDIAPVPAATVSAHPDIMFRQCDFVDDGRSYDLVTLNDVIEHVTEPQLLLRDIAERARYVALHIPLDDRLSVSLTNQYNYRLASVGHISFWNPASAINLLTAAGLLPVACRFTPGFMAPSGRQRLIQRIAIPFRYVAWAVSPPLAAASIGGVSLAVVCRGRRLV